jgi:hypothetical protein
MAGVRAYICADGCQGLDQEEFSRREGKGRQAKQRIAEAWRAWRLGGIEDSSLTESAENTKNERLFVAFVSP